MYYNNMLHYFFPTEKNGMISSAEHEHTTQQPQTSHLEMFLLKTEQPYTEEEKVLEPASYSPAWTTNIIQKFVGI